MAYTSAVTLDQPHAQRISRDLGVLTGICNITLDHQSTPAEITDITDHFPTLFEVIVTGVSDNGHIVKWNKTDKCFHGYHPTKAQTSGTGVSHGHAFTGTSRELPPPMIYEESVTITTHEGDLAYDAAFILYIGDGAKPYSIIDKSLTPDANEVAVDFTPATGKTHLTFNSADAVTTAYVTYWPALSNQILADNLVESDTVDGTPVSGHASLAGEVITITDAAAAIISVTVDGVAWKPVCTGEAQAAGEYDCNFLSGSDTVLTGNGAEFSGASVIIINFIKHDAKLNYIHSAEAHAADIVTILGWWYMPRLACWTIVDDAADNPQRWIDSADTLGGDDVQLEIHTTSAGVRLVFEAALDVADVGHDYIAMHPLEAGHQTHVPAGANAAEATHTHAVVSSVGVIVGDDVDIGEIHFIAIGTHR